MRKPFVILAVVALLNASLMWGCGERSPASSQSDPALDRDTQGQMADAERREYWIAQMGSFVTQSDDGTYVFDEAGFTAAYGSLPDTDQAVFNELKQCIPIANQKVREMPLSDGMAKLTFSRYWWGYKECYSELSAEYMLDFMQISAYGYPAYVWAKYFYYNYGRFCVNHSWLPPAIWITAS